jgi:hypothetical protein
MAATQWAFYHQAKHKIGIGLINLSADIFRLALFKSGGAGEADTKTLSLKSQVSNECSGGAYATHGKTLSNTTWTTTATSVQKFNGDDWIITASGSSITSIKHAAVFNSLSAGGGYLLCFSQLSTTQISVTTGNTLTIQMATGGVFTLA